MKTRYLVDPEFLPALDSLEAFDNDYSLENLPNLRTKMNAMYAQMLVADPATAAIERRELTIPGPEGAPELRLLVYAHKDGGAGRPAYFFTHGGGYIMGTPEMNEPGSKRIALEAGCVVIATSYRLAPETVFPGNVEDCYAALKWVHANARQLGIDPGRIAIGGESAGGGLTAALALLVRDRREIPIIHQQLVYPMLDDRSTDSSHPYTGEFGWTREKNRLGWAALLGQAPGGPEVSPYAAAARAETLAGLPSTFIGVGTLDLFLEENVAYALRLTEADVPVELHVYPGAFHGSDLVTAARLTEKHVRDQVEALRAAFNR